MVIRKQPGELWQFFMENVYRLKYQDYIIAEGDGGVKISLASSDEYDPVLFVESDGKVVACCVVSDESNLGIVAEDVYKKYLYADETEESEPDQESEAEPDGEQAEEPADEDEPADPEDEIFEREDALMMAFKDFMSVVVCEDELIYDKYLEPDLAKLLDMVLQTVSDEGYMVYRPMYVTEDDGTESLVSFPYETEEVIFEE